MTDLSLRTAGFTDSVIRRMTRISNQYGAVNLSQGFPDFEPPKEILERLAQVTKEDFHQYATTWGSQNFRDAVAAKQKHFMGYDIDPNSEIVVTCGSTEAIPTRAIRSSYSRRSMRTTARTLSFPAPSLSTFRLFRRSTASTQTCWKRRSGSTPRR